MLTMTGVIATDPQLRWTTGENARPVLSFLLVSDSTRFNPKAGERGEWETRRSTSLWVSLWRDPKVAEQILTKGMAVIVVGELFTETIEHQRHDGGTDTEYRTRLEAQHLGPDLAGRTEATRTFWTSTTRGE